MLEPLVPEVLHIPLSDDEKHVLTDEPLEAISGHTRGNLRDLLAVGFDPERTRIVVDTIHSHAYSGGQASVEEHREQGGDPEVDVPYLYYFFEDDDERVERLACEYRDGTLLSDELKRIAAEEIAAFLELHRE